MMPIADQVPNQAVSNNLLTLSEAANALRCSKSFVSKLINGSVRGVALPAVRIGRRRLIRRAAFENWLQLHEKGEW